MSGRIVLLNGPPRSGKSTIARALQSSLSDTWINLGVDAMMAMTPAALRPGIGLRPGGERPDLEPAVTELYGGLLSMIAALSREGVNVVSDLGIHDAYSRPLGILRLALRRLENLPVLFVGVTCPLAIIMARRNADPQNGLYVAGDGVPDPVRRWQEAVHAHADYDLTVDTAAHSGQGCAAAIAAMLDDPPAIRAFDRLRTPGGTN